MRTFTSDEAAAVLDMKFQSLVGAMRTRNSTGSASGAWTFQSLVGAMRTPSSAVHNTIKECPFTGPVELGRCAGFDLGRRVGVSA